MGKTEDLRPQGEKIKKALKWISEMVSEHPEKSREQILRDAEIRFDLSPSECEFLDNNFS
jgi:ATP-dependent protease ClpP protease subunit